MIDIKTMQTRQIFDKSKVDKGDIVEWDVYRGLFKPKVIYRNIGLVTKYEPETLWVKALDTFETSMVAEIGLPVDRDDITVIKRHPLNEG